MAFFRGSRSAASHEEVEVVYDPLETVRVAGERLKAARTARDRAISSARMERVPLREIADAAGLSLTRVKQVSSASSYGARHPGVTEVDLTASNAVDRVLALRDLDAFLPQFPSERAFIAADERRRTGDRYDISFRLYDADDIETPWTATWVSSTKEIYVNKAREDRGRGWNPEPVTDEPAAELGEGAPWGPCIVLGRLPSWEIVSAGLDEAIHQVVDRPGGLAWMLGRIRRINRLLRAVQKESYGHGEEHLREYVESLTDDDLRMA